MSTGAALSAMAGRRIVKPGSSLALAAQPLADPTRAEGKYPFQWLYPGPHSKPAMPNGSIAVPIQNSPGAVASGVIFTYQVPQNYRMRLSGIYLGAFAPDWNQGSGALTFSLQIAFSTGPRTVEFLDGVPFNLGQPGIPWPIPGRLEFDSLSILQPLVNNVSLGTPGANGFAYCMLDGFLYPEQENS